MKKLIKYIVGFWLAVILFGGLMAYAFWSGKTMAPSQVKKQWGHESLDIKKFRSSSHEVKAKMAYAIMTDKSFVGKSYEEIRELFRPNEGYYMNDTTPAYIIYDGSKSSENTWQLVFRMDNNYKVRDVIMHKNCCN
ncbi:MAG: hypothetical protein H7328_06500 [Bdellovibrio sp.]|nr:hypothetical protein [Bdellovibrio sp.]